MICRECHSEIPEGSKFCKECGRKFDITCSECGKSVPPESKFCLECGHHLEGSSELEKPMTAPDAERKQITALFSDLTGYTAMTGQLDPEDVREITGKIFQEIKQVVTRYDGFIEKFAGDGALILFGVPQAHEDDPVRAIRAAREIHDCVDAISPLYEPRLGRRLTMHSGINTGLAVTADVNSQKGTHVVTGEAINIAARLSELAKTGQILVGSKTMHASEGHFTFRDLGKREVKGKAEPIPIYELVGSKEKPDTTHRITGLRAELTGRSVEMARLSAAVQRLKDGEGSVICVCGDPGTGKSRLVQEFKTTLDPTSLSWLEGHCYPYSQNISYFPLIDLMNRAWQIREDDPPENIREKIEFRLQRLLGANKELIPYIGSLYALSYPEIAQIIPEYWKSRFIEAVKAVVAALAQLGPTVFCFEDIHWADQPTIDLLRIILTETRHPALFLNVYRPPFQLFPDSQGNIHGRGYEEVRLQDLSSDDARRMLQSLLKIETIPDELIASILKKTEGNPFYLEEVANSLMETGILIRKDGGLVLTRPMIESDVPSTVQGVISARLDRLGRDMKLVLQEASVIGRAFAYDILKQISQIRDNIDKYLQGLEKLDIVRALSVQPELEYIFKHALTQEVVYIGLLKKERQEIHERIGLVMERVFQDRLSEFYETLAYHFKQGRTVLKAIHYLMKSGEKSLNRFAVDQSHQYYKYAFDLLSTKPERTSTDNRIMMDLLLDWAYVFYFRGDWLCFEALLEKHEELAKSLDDKSLLGMFYAWFGLCEFCRAKCKKADELLKIALRIGEEIDDQHVIGYTCISLAWCCAELGRLDEGIRYGEKSNEISKLFPSDHYLHFQSVVGTAFCHAFKGDSRKGIEWGQACIEYGLHHGNVRFLSIGQGVTGLVNFNRGNLETAIENWKKAVEAAADPFCRISWIVTLALGYAVSGEYGSADNELLSILEQCDVLGYDLVKVMCQLPLSLVTIAKGEMGEGLRLLEEGCRICFEQERRWFYVLYECCLGNVYLQIVQGEGDLSISIMMKNIGFLIKNVPFASKKAESHFNKAIQVAEEIGAIGLMGQAHLGLGRLHKAKKRKDKARECLLKAVDCFERCEAETIMKQTREEIDSLG